MIEHLFCPKATFLEITNELAVKHNKVARQVALNEKILVGRLNARRGAHDVRNGGGRRDGEHVGIAHAVFGNLFAQWLPVHLSGAGYYNFFATFFGQYVQGVLRHEAALPLGAFVAAVGALLRCQISRCFVGVVGDSFHELVIELNGSWGGEGYVLFVESILQTHNT